MDVEDESLNLSPSEIKLSLDLYYKKFFPHQSMYNWLSYGDDEYLSRREFSTTMDDIYIRYKTFSNVDGMKTDIIKSRPDKIDIGAVYNTSPANHTKVSNFAPQEKELVFDIDATDYSDVFVSTEKTSFITSLTWPLMSVAIQVLDDLLRNDFGFEHIMWVFSGRRGIHGWVCDRAARQLPNSARSAIAEYLQVVTGHDGSANKVNLKNTLHPSLKRVYDNILHPMFLQYFVEEQQLLMDPKHIENILKFFPEEIRNNAQESWEGEKNGNSMDRWLSLETTFKNYSAKKRNWKNPLHDIVFTYTYPRLDINVSKQMNHLLKSPFVIHPGTGRVCVPIDIKNVTSFQPEKVPTVATLREEIDRKGAENFSSSLMQPYVKILDEFVKKTHLDDQRSKAAERKLKSQSDLDF
eukprot:TRINITY_DN7717_c0_g1_i1.p1 TRINITY_DN7717_c0_g1~~TRINITY_DN7717_c0_g1_i1.p1  ORF type:complete len:409 (+),score=82.96 TRINITY_DN7717_c0_g1_i1:77-1303(+)